MAKRNAYSSAVADGVTLVDAKTATQDPTAADAYGVVPAVWRSSSSGLVSEVDISAWAAGSVTLTNVDFMAGVFRPGTIANDAFDSVNATTNAITAAAHGLQTGDGPLRITSAGGALPAPLVAATDYWVIRVDANSFKLAETRALAIAGTAIDLTDTGSGSAHQFDGTASTERARWIPAKTLTASIALTLRSGGYWRAALVPEAFAYGIRATWGGAVAASFEMRPVDDR